MFDHASDYIGALEQQSRTLTAETAFVRMNKFEVIAALEHDSRFFINFFLGEELEFPVPDFHIETFDLMVNDNIEQSAHALPRGHAKTTLAKLAAVKKFLFTRTRYIAYISSTHGVAAEACQNITKYLLSPNCVAVFGMPEFFVKQDQKGFYKFNITLPHFTGPDGKPVTKMCILRAFGAGQQIRGTNIDDERPELAICDDVEDDENMATKEQIKKLRNWFFGAFIKALSKKNRRIIFIGNMLSAQSLLYHFTNVSDQWYSQRYGCLLSNGQPLWPELWSLEAIRNDFIEYQKIGLVGRWFAEMMNIAMPDSSPLIKSDAIHYVPPVVPGEPELCFITIDPAISRETWADKTGVAVHALVNGVWVIAEYAHNKFEPAELFFIVMSLCQKWRTKAVGIEAATFQKALKYLFEVFMHMHQYHFSVIEVPHGNARKTDRLSVWTSFITRKLYGIVEGDFAITEQLLRYDPTKRENDDDLIDACAMGPIMLENFMGEIIDSYSLEEKIIDVSMIHEIQGA